MKNKLAYYIVLFCVLTACKKLEVDSVDFDVTTEKNTYSLGDTVTFHFNGEPDYLLFYSGETGAKYQFRNRIEEAGEPIMNFTSLKTGNSSAKIELLISSDCTGVYEKSVVKSATWNDLTTNAVFSTGADNTPSGNISLKAYQDASRPVYLAFKSSKPADNLNQVFAHSIKTLNIQNILSDGSIHSINPGTNLQGWKNVDSLLSAIAWSVNSSNQLNISSITANANEANEDWAISGAIDLSKAIPDKARTIKSMAMVMPPKFEHVFAQRGTYKVSFVAYNQTSKDKKEVVKEFEIHIN